MFEVEIAEAGPSIDDVETWDDCWSLNSMEIDPQTYEGADPLHHSQCGHFHFPTEGCPEAPCGSYLCCLN